MPQIVGTYENSRDFGFVISDNPKFSKDVFIPRKDSQGIKDGDKGSGGNHRLRKQEPQSGR